MTEPLSDADAPREEAATPAPGSGRTRLLAALLIAAAAGGIGYTLWKRAAPDVVAQRRLKVEARRAELLARKVYDERGFQPMKKAQPGEWLYAYPEFGQTFAEHVEAGPLVKGTDGRTKIVLQPLTPLSKPVEQVMEKFRRYCAAFFASECTLAEPIPVPESVYAKDRKQYDASPLLGILDGRRPKEALIYAGVADVDLYTHDTNFVFGLGWLSKGIGVYSTKRKYFHGIDPLLFLKRGCATLGHEGAHTLGMDHCIYYDCLLNGSKSLKEGDKQPLHLCPVCLRKLHHALGFDVVARYKLLRDFYADVGMKPEAAWVAERIAQLEKEGTKVLWKTK